MHPLQALTPFFSDFFFHHFLHNLKSVIVDVTILLAIIIILGLYMSELLTLLLVATFHSSEGLAVVLYVHRGGWTS